jgi:hypothetical protein
MDKKLERRFRRMRHKTGSPPHDKTAFAMGALWGNKSPPVRFIGGKVNLFFERSSLWKERRKARCVTR